MGGALWKHIITATVENLFLTASWLGGIHLPVVEFTFTIVYEGLLVKAKLYVDENTGKMISRNELFLPLPDASKKVGSRLCK